MAFQGSASLVAGITGRDTALADAGAVYTALNPVSGSAIIGHAAPTVFDQTKALLFLYNSGALSIYPQNLRLKLIIPAASSTNVRFTQVIDRGVNRVVGGPSVGVVITPNNTNISVGNNSGAGGVNGLLFGPVVLTAPSASARTICDAVYRPVIGVAFDTYQFVWGSSATGARSDASTSGVLVADITVSYPPIAIPPNSMFAIHQWSPNQIAPASFEFEFDYVEK